METEKSPGTDSLPAEFYKVLRILESSLHTIKVNCQSLRERYHQTNPENGCRTSFCQELETVNIAKLRLQDSN